MNYLLFSVYLILLCWLLLRMPVIKNLGINNKTIIGLFLFKVIAGIAIGWISIHIYGPGNDYWDINDEAWKEYQLLITSPGKYFINLFTSDYPGGYSGMFGSYDSYWNDLTGNIIIKLVSIFNILSRGDYYINSLFFNFIIFFGHVTFYKLFIKIYPHKKTGVIIGCFLLPSTIYFSSGIHKDGLVFLMLSVLVYWVYQWLQQNKITIKRLLLICVCLIFLFLIRPFIFIALAPALAAWFIAVKTKWPVLWTFTGVYLITGLLFFNIGSVLNKIKPMEIIIAKQTEYLQLQKSDTEIKLTPLQPNFKSFATNAPQALNHLLLRPYVWELPVKSLLPLNIELAFYQILFLLFLFFRKRDAESANRLFYCFIVFFTLTIFLLIGYIVPNLGSIVRYRSIYLPLLITPLLCLVDWNKLIKPSKIIK